MTQALDVFDGVRYVEFSTDGGIVAVWHGGHTINVYGTPTTLAEYAPIDALTVGDVSTGETTLADAKEGIQILMDMRGDSSDTSES